MLVAAGGGAIFSSIETGQVLSFNLYIWWLAFSLFGRGKKKQRGKQKIEKSGGRWSDLETEWKTKKAERSESKDYDVVVKQ